MDERPRLDRPDGGSAGLSCLSPRAQNQGLRFRSIGRPGESGLSPQVRRHYLLAARADSRKVLAWRLSTTLETGPCIEALEDAMRRHGKPEIMNTDQGSQFTSIDFIRTLKVVDIQISMDGKGAWRDNVFVERLWRKIKYEEVYLRAYDSVSAARESLRRYLTFYNTRRPHSSLDGQAPDQAYLNTSSPIPVAA